jgi:hypothetical protein
MSEVLDRQAVYDTMRADSAPATACKGDLAVAIRRHRRRHDRMGGATRDRLLRRDSVGDQVDVDFGDLLDLFSADRATRAIVLYVESIKDARKSCQRPARRHGPSR